MEEEQHQQGARKRQRICDVGGAGDCGFLSIIASLVNHAAPPRLWTNEVRAMRDLLGCYWKLKEPPKATDEIIQASLEPDPEFPQEDVSQAGVFMQDRDIILLLHLMDLDEIVVGEQTFVQDKTWGEAIREVLAGILVEFWAEAWVLKGKKKANIHHSRLHFRAVIRTSSPAPLSPPPSPITIKRSNNSSYYY